MSGIAVQELCVQFGHHEPVLHELSFEIPAGSIVALLGGSGSGKSTLLRAIAKLQPITSGQVRFTESDDSHQASELAYVFQDATLLPWRTVRENVRLPLELAQRGAANLSAVQRSQAVDEALTSVGLPQASWSKYPRQLSGGMRMRVSLARAIVTDPAVLLLDEPFAALDEILRGRMNELLLELWLRKARTVLFVTHNIAEAINLSQRMAILGSGRIHSWIDNPLPIPRTAHVRSSPQFAELYSQVSTTLLETVSDSNFQKRGRGLLQPAVTDTGFENG